MDSQNAIEVRNMYKQFKVDYDKAHTLKDKLLFQVFCRFSFLSPDMKKSLVDSTLSRNHCKLFLSKKNI